MSALQERFTAMVRRYGSQTAIVQGETALTYDELAERAGVFGAALLARGVRPGDAVALKYTRSPELFVAMLGVVMIGGTFVPLDDASPTARLLTCLSVADASVICTNQVLADALGEGRAVLTHSDVMQASQVADWSTTAVGDDAPAYIMFTSGSTGVPKGVAVPHRAIYRLVIDTNFIEISQDDALLQLSPVSFDASTLEIWGAFLNGARLVLYSGSVLDPRVLKKDIADHGVSVAWLTAALFHLAANAFPDALKPLRVLLAGGDVLHAPVIRDLLNRLPHLEVVNGYGPTENTTFTCCHLMTKSNPPADSVPIGQPVTGTEVHLLDDRRRPVRNGDVGELYASGSGVALGYLGDPPGDAFFKDASIARGLIYRTGDLARRNDDGDIEFCGRVDNQVKLRGFRVSLEEISSCLTDMSAVADAVIFVDQQDSGDQLLVACIRPSDGAALDSDGIRAAMGERVPAYMVPDRIVLIHDMPVTANGKLDRKAVVAACNGDY